MNAAELSLLDALVKEGGRTVATHQIARMSGLRRVNGATITAIARRNLYSLAALGLVEGVRYKPLGPVVAWKATAAGISYMADLAGQMNQAA